MKLAPLLPLPAPDGAPLFCSLLLNVNKWPYVKRCDNKADGLLADEDFQRLYDTSVNLGGTAICVAHYEDMKAGVL